MPSGSIYTYVGNEDPRNGTSSILTSQGLIAIGQYGYFIPQEVLAAEAMGLVLKAGIVPPATPGQSSTPTQVFNTGIQIAGAAPSSLLGTDAGSNLVSGPLTSSVVSGAWLGNAYSVTSPVYGADNTGATDARPKCALAVAAAVAAIQATGQPAAVRFPAGLYSFATGVTKAALVGSADAGGGAGSFSNLGVPLPVNLPATLAIIFDPGATIKLSTSCMNAFYIDKQADYDTFQNIWMFDPTVDKNNTQSRSHILVGNVPNNQTKQRYLNFSNIRIYRPKMINGSLDPTQAANQTYHIAFIGDHNGALEATQTSSKGIWIVEPETNNADFGVMIASTPAARVRPGGCNHYYDDIHILRPRFVNTVVPTVTSSQTSVWVCGAGFGDFAEIIEPYSENVADDAIEFGAMQTAIIDSPVSMNPFYEGLLFRHTHAPINYHTQRVDVRGARTKVTSALSQGTTGYSCCPIRFTMDDGVWTLTENGGPTGGTFTIGLPTQVNGTVVTAAVNYNDSAVAVASAVQTALLSGGVTGAACTGTGGPLNSSPITLTLGNVNLVGPIATTSSLTGGTNPSVSTAIVLASSAPFGNFTFTDSSFDADQLQYSKQGNAKELFVRGLDQPVRRAKFERPQVYLSNYTFDNGTNVDLSLIHPNNPQGNNKMHVIIRDFDVVIDGTSNFAASTGIGLLHDVLVEGNGTRVTVDGIEKDASGASNGSFAMVGVAKNGGSNIRVNVRRLNPKANGSASGNLGLRVFSTGSVDLVMLAQSMDIASFTLLDLANAGANATKVQTARNQNIATPSLSETGLWTPLDHGLCMTPGDPNTFQAIFAVVSGTIYYVRARAMDTRSLANLLVAFNSTTNTTFTTGQCFHAICDSAGNKLAVTADQAATWQAAGQAVKSGAVSGVTVQAGLLYYLVFLANFSGTAPVLCRPSGTNGNVNFGISSSPFAVGTSAILQTSIGNSISLATGGSNNILLGAN